MAYVIKTSKKLTKPKMQENNYNYVIFSGIVTSIHNTKANVEVTIVNYNFKNDKTTIARAIIKHDIYKENGIEIKKNDKIQIKGFLHNLNIDCCVQCLGIYVIEINRL